jgi:hypothetical protein
MSTPTAQKSASTARKSASAAQKSASAAHQGMTAPPSTAYKIVDIPELYRDVVKRYGVPGTFGGTKFEET